MPAFIRNRHTRISICTSVHLIHNEWSGHLSPSWLSRLNSCAIMKSTVKVTKHLNNALQNNRCPSYLLKKTGRKHISNQDQVQKSESTPNRKSVRIAHFRNNKKGPRSLSYSHFLGMNNTLKSCSSNNKDPVCYQDQINCIYKIGC